MRIVGLGHGPDIFRLPRKCQRPRSLANLHPVRSGVEDFMHDQPPKSIAQRLAQVLSLSPQTTAIEFEGRTISWGQLADGAAAIEAALQAAGIPPDAPVGWAARNRPAGVAAFVALLTAGRPIAPLRPNQSLNGFQDEIRAQRLAAVIADDGDWALDGVAEAAAEAGSVGVRVSERGGFTVGLAQGLERMGVGPHRPSTPGMVIERMSSGTTGPPKRIPVLSSRCWPRWTPPRSPPPRAWPPRRSR